jgi:hypothetical protein
VTKPLDQFWVLTDEQAGGRVAYVSVAYSRTHTQANGERFIAISPTFKSSADMKAHILRMISDLNDALPSVDIAFGDR